MAKDIISFIKYVFTNYAEHTLRALTQKSINDFRRTDDLVFENSLNMNSIYSLLL